MKEGVMPDFLPSRDGLLVTWSVNFKTKITATPTVYALTAAQATAYGLKHDAYAAAYQTAKDPSTRTPSSVLAKDVAKKNLETEARMLARIVQAAPAVTNQQRSDLGLTVRDVEPSPIDRPAFAPEGAIVSVTGRSVRIRYRDAQEPSRRGKPNGCAGLAVFSHVGATRRRA
jgi:hypothetical protein